MTRIAIIPARSGSKRIPDKNIREFLGVPMLSRTIAILNQSMLFDQIFVSTDSEHYSTIARSAGAVVPFLRSAELAHNYTPTVEVIASFLEEIELDDADVCCVYAPNPFLMPSVIESALLMMNAVPRPDYATAVTTFPFPIQRSLQATETGLFQMSLPENILVHSQDLEQRFHETAQFWWAKASTWRFRRPMQMNLKGIVIPRWLTQDIDNAEDWAQAEIRYRIITEMYGEPASLKLDELENSTQGPI